MGDETTEAVFTVRDHNAAHQHLISSRTTPFYYLKPGADRDETIQTHGWVMSIGCLLPYARALPTTITSASTWGGSHRGAPTSADTSSKSLCEASPVQLILETCNARQGGFDVVSAGDQALVVTESLSQLFSATRATSSGQLTARTLAFDGSSFFPVLVGDLEVSDIGVGNVVDPACVREGARVHDIASAFADINPLVALFACAGRWENSCISTPVVFMDEHPRAAFLILDCSPVAIIAEAAFVDGADREFCMDTLARWASQRQRQLAVLSPDGVPADIYAFGGRILTPTQHARHSQQCQTSGHRAQTQYRPVALSLKSLCPGADFSLVLDCPWAVGAFSKSARVCAEELQHGSTLVAAMEHAMLVLDATVTDPCGGFCLHLSDDLVDEQHLHSALCEHWDMRCAMSDATHIDALLCVLMFLQTSSLPFTANDEVVLQRLAEHTLWAGPAHASAAHQAGGRAALAVARGVLASLLVEPPSLRRAARAFSFSSLLHVRMFPNTETFVGWTRSDDTYFTRACLADTCVAIAVRVAETSEYTDLVSRALECIEGTFERALISVARQPNCYQAEAQCARTILISNLSAAAIARRIHVAFQPAEPLAILVCCAADLHYDNTNNIENAQIMNAAALEMLDVWCPSANARQIFNQTSELVRNKLA